MSGRAEWEGKPYKTVSHWLYDDVVTVKVLQMVIDEVKPDPSDMIDIDKVKPGDPDYWNYDREVHFKFYHRRK